jgi:hypothetical protein
MILAVSLDPHSGHTSGASLAVTMTSALCPQAWHWMS